MHFFTLTKQSGVWILTARRRGRSWQAWRGPACIARGCVRCRRHRAPGVRAAAWATAVPRGLSRPRRHTRAGGSSWRPTSPAGGLSVSKEIWPQGRRAGQGAGGGERAVALGAGCPRPAPADTRHPSGSPSRWFAVREPHTGFTLRGARHLPERGGVSAPGAGAAGLS